MTSEDSGTDPGALQVRDLHIALGERVLVHIERLDVAPGEIVTLMGPSGSGKSTLLAWLTGTIDRAFEVSGRSSLGQRALDMLPAQSRRLGIQFQDDLLFPHLSVGANLAFGLAPRHRGRAARRALVEAALEDAGLAGFHDRDPATLSGGQRARAALMRTLLAEPQGLLLDEPFNRLDAQLRADFRAFVFEHARARRLPTLLVTHDEADAASAGGRVLRIG